MRAGGHYASGAVTGLTMAQVGHLHPVLAFACAGLAARFAGGRWSPDMDQCGPWRTFLGRPIVRWFHDRFEHGGPGRHRGLSHWWALPVAASVPVQLVPRDGALSVLWWLLMACLAGWASHLLTDAVWGAKGYGRNAGIPVLPWWCHVGIGLKSDGWTSLAFEHVVFPVAGGALFWMIVRPGVAWW